MRFLIHWILAFFIFLNPTIVLPALTDYDRQELAFENALADKNPGFESGVTQWTTSGGTLGTSTGTQLIPKSKQYGTWDSNSAGQTLQTAAVTVPKTGNCEFTIWLAVPSGTATHTITVTDGTNDLSIPYTITTNVNAQKHRVPFLCPASGTVRGKLTSVNSNEPSLSLDNGRIGSATNVGTSDFETPWESCTFAGNGFTGGSNTTSAQCRRNGPNLEVKASTTFTTVFTGGNATYTIPTAVGCTIDTAKVPNSGSGTPMIGKAELRDIGTDQHAAVVTLSSSTAVLLRALQDDSGPSSTSIVYSAISTTVPFTWANNDIISFEFSVPCVGWGPATTITAEQQRLPKITRYTSGSGTHTTTPGTTYMRIRMVGGGGGGGASGTASWGAATAGGNSTFGSSLLTANGGSAGGQSGLANGGSVTVNSPALQLVAVPGQGGQGATYSNPSSGNVATMGGNGGSTFFGGAGSGSSYGTAGSAAASNTGSGGGGAGGSSTTIGFYSGSGGGAGGFIEAQIDFPSSSYAYAVGANGAGGTAGTSGLAGGNGSGGLIEVTEFFGYTTALIANSVIARDAVNGQVTTVNTIVSPTTTYAATANDETINASTSGGAWTLSLPAAAGVKGKKYHINQTADTANALTIDPNSSETICGQSTIVVRGLRDSITIQSDGTNWIGLDQSCWRSTTARLDCDSASTIQIDRQYSVSTIGNISGGTCAVTMPTGNYSGTPDCGANWNGNGASNDMYAVCSSATSCAVGSIGAATTAQLHFSCRGPR